MRHRMLYLTAVCGLVAFMLACGVSLGLVMVGPAKPDPGLAMQGGDEDMHIPHISVSGLDMYELSLFVREQTDFLLTPALLVQEAITDGVILTYPGE